MKAYTMSARWPTSASPVTPWRTTAPYGNTRPSMTHAMVGAARLRAAMNAIASARCIGSRVRHRFRSIGSRSADQMIAGVAAPHRSRRTICSSTGARSATRSAGARTTTSDRTTTYRIAASHNATMTRPAVARYEVDMRAKVVRGTWWDQR